MTRKSLLLTAAIFGLSIAPLSARQLTPDESLSRITPTEMNRIKAAAPQAQLQLKSTGYDTAGNAAYYVFAAGDRTLFASADDVAAPLLGYVVSHDFNINDMPPAMSWWLSEYARQIAWAAANGAKPYAATRAADTKSPIAPLIKTTWNQGAPYNDLCPQKNGQTTYTGCVATSTAQVMNYHQWPSQGTGTVSYDWNGQTLSMDLGATTFAWDDMLDSYPTATTGTDAQRQAVATLMKACGYALHMNYGLAADGGSGAFSFDIPNVLADNFSYDAATRIEYRDFYEASVWENMMYDNLANIGPVIYGGSGSLGGHSFVCDGYDTDGLFHINWGWGSTSDGYFLLSALNPPSLGAGGGAGGFNYEQDAILGIQTPQPGSVKPLPAIGGISVKRIYASLSSGVITVSIEQEDINPHLFLNVGSTTGTFSYGLKFVKDDSTDQTVIVKSNNVQDRELAPSYGYAYIDANMPDEMSDGTYKVYPVYTVNGSPWKDIMLPYGMTNYISISVQSGITTIDPSSAAPGVSIESFSCPTGLIIGKPYTIDLIVTSTYPLTRMFKFAASLTEVDSGFWVDDLESAKITLTSGETAPVTITGTLGNTIEEGEYNLIIREETAGDIQTYRVAVTNSSSKDETAEDASDSATSLWYDLSGRPVNPANLSQGIYIRTDGIHTDKVMVK